MIFFTELSVDLIDRKSNSGRGSWGVKVYLEVIWVLSQQSLAWPQTKESSQRLSDSTEPFQHLQTSHYHTFTISGGRDNNSLITSLVWRNTINDIHIHILWRQCMIHPSSWYARFGVGSTGNGYDYDKSFWSQLSKLPIQYVFSLSAQTHPRGKLLANKCAKLVFFCLLESSLGGEAQRCSLGTWLSPLLVPPPSTQPGKNGDWLNFYPIMDYFCHIIEHDWTGRHYDNQIMVLVQYSEKHSW